MAARLDDATRAAPGRIRQRNRARILAAAERIFAEKGYDGATTAAIAAAAGLPKSNLHYYFPTKEAVYRAVIDGTLRLWLAAFDPIAADDDPAEALAAYVRRKMRHSFEHPLASRVFAQEVLRGAPVVRDFLAGELREWVEARSAVIRAWIAQGRMAPLEPAPPVLHRLGRDPDLRRLRRPDHGRARPRAPDGGGPRGGDGAVGVAGAARLRARAADLGRGVGGRRG